MKNKILFLVIFLLSVSTLVIASSNLFVNKIEQCQNTTLTSHEEVPIYNDVVKNRTTYGFVDTYFSNNNTWGKVYIATGLEQYTEQVQVGTENVTRYNTVCEDTSYLKISTDTKAIGVEYLGNNFECKDLNGSVMCDSKWDGNGDGICDSGESCYLLQREGDCIAITHGNSWDKGFSIKEKTVNGVCFKIYYDESFRKDWELLRGDSQ